MLLRPPRPSPSPRGPPSLLRSPCSPLPSVVHQYDRSKGSRDTVAGSRSRVVLHAHSSLTPGWEFIGLRLPAVKFLVCHRCRRHSAWSREFPGCLISGPVHETVVALSLDDETPRRDEWHTSLVEGSRAESAWQGPASGAMALHPAARPPSHEAQVAVQVAESGLPHVLDISPADVVLALGYSEIATSASLDAVRLPVPAAHDRGHFLAERHRGSGPPR